MTISVAIATYNRAQMVSEAVSAALAQSRMPEEVIVSDDASIDETVARIQSLAAGDGRIKLVRQTRNSGGVRNWNTAMAATRGELIAWCSDDDRFLPGHLEASAAYLEAHPASPGFIDSIESGEGQQREPRPLRRESILTGDHLIPYLIRHYDWPFHPSTMVLRRSVWEQVGPFHPAYHFSDTEWFLRVVEKFPVATLARHGVLNRRHPGNWSNRLGSAHLQREVFEMVDEMIARDYRGWERTLLHASWRANVRMRLALALRARLESRHEEAARAVWHGLLQDTGLATPGWIERAGGAAIGALCAGREPQFRDQGQSVSPL